MDNRELKKKFRILSVVSLVLALAIFVFTFRMYHYGTADLTFTDIWHDEPEKPFITLLFGVWGTIFLFSSVMSLVVSIIFFNKKRK